ncbi:MAG: DUF4912 domain-containing protein [Halanaerobiales bacterium]
MGIFLNILVIILAVITFLILYYRTLEKERKSQDYQLPFRRVRTDLETGEEIGVDRKTMTESDNRSSKQEEPPIKTLLETEELKVITSSSGEINVELSREFGNRGGVKDEPYQLKEKYKNNFIRLFNRDPYYLYTYWEINNQEFYENTPFLRLYNVNKNSHNDIKINHHSNNWYVGSESDNEYRVELGYKKAGIFYPLVTSQKVRTPLDRPSNIIDEHWMTIEELSCYSFRIEMDTMSIIKSIEGRKIQEDMEADSFTLIQK